MNRIKNQIKFDLIPYFGFKSKSNLKFDYKFMIP